MKRRQKNKKKNKPSRGVLKNPFEREIKKRLSNLGASHAYETEYLNYVLPKVKKYLPDFVVTVGRRKIYVEAKGWFRPADRTKMLAVKASNPGLDIRFVFLRDNKINKGSKTTYSEWCARHGFMCHVGTDIPKDWFM